MIDNHNQSRCSVIHQRWKEKSHITDLKERRKAEWAAILIQRTIRAWLVRTDSLRLVRHTPAWIPNYLYQRNISESDPILKFRSDYITIDYYLVAVLFLTLSESQTSRVHHRKPAFGVAAVQGVAQVAAVHENADNGHKADIPQMEGKKGESKATRIKEWTRRAFTVPPISAAIRPNLEEPDEGEGDREHYLQGQKGLLPEKVMLM